MKNSNQKDSIWFEIMLVLLACVAGSVDVMSYYRLGSVFTANMTGNTVLLGFSIGQGNVASSLHRLAALAGFFSGALIGAYIVENTKKGWSNYITVSISIETTIIFILVYIWFFEGKVIGDFALYVSIILAGLAMGIQSAAIRHLNIPGIITSFLTGTITSIGMGIVKGIKSGFKKKVKRDNPTVPSPKTLDKESRCKPLFLLLMQAPRFLQDGWSFTGRGFYRFFP